MKQLWDDSNVTERNARSGLRKYDLAMQLWHGLKAWEGAMHIAVEDGSAAEQRYRLDARGVAAAYLRFPQVVNARLCMLDWCEWER